MHRLTWAIDTAISKNNRLINGAIGLIALVTPSACKHHARLIAIGIGKHHMITQHLPGIIEIFAISIGYHFVYL